MAGPDLDRWRHDHTFGNLAPADGERRTRWVIGLTAATMVVELAAGTAFGSMALLADGWHMASHAAALSITAFAYWFARRHARSARFSFGTGKAWSLGGFASAVALAVVAALVLVESVVRLFAPVTIRFDEAIAVAALGLAVNLLSAWLLGAAHDHDGEHPHEHDHNLRAAYLHVLADALTSVAALIALASGRLFGWGWMDPLMGIVGALVIARWSYGLLRATGTVLLDAEADAPRLASIRARIEAEPDTHVVDLHVWRVGPQQLAAIVAVVTAMQRAPEHYRRLLSDDEDLVHVTVEVQALDAPAQR